MIEAVRNKTKKLFAGVTLFSLEIVLLSVIFFGALVAFIFIARMIFKEDKSSFDLQAGDFVSRFVSDVNTSVMEFFTFLGTPTFLIPANLLLVAYFLLLKKHRWYSISVPVVSITSLVLMLSLKYIFHRDRPVSPLLQQARGYSFPSGHALMSFTFYGLLIYLTWLNVKKIWLRWVLSILLALLIFTIGLSRVYLRVHYASDVLAGYCVGCMWLLLSLWLLKKVERFSHQKVTPAIETGTEPSGSSAKTLL